MEASRLCKQATWRRRWQWPSFHVDFYALRCVSWEDFVAEYYDSGELFRKLWFRR